MQHFRFDLVNSIWKLKIPLELKISVLHGHMRRGRGGGWHGTMGKGGRLKKKGRPIGPRWVVSSSWTFV
jgi:hypothetical protein